MIHISVLAWPQDVEGIECVVSMETTVVVGEEEEEKEVSVEAEPRCRWRPFFQRRRKKENVQEKVLASAITVSASSSQVTTADPQKVEPEPVSSEMMIPSLVHVVEESSLSSLTSSLSESRHNNDEEGSTICSWLKSGRQEHGADVRLECLLPSVVGPIDQRRYECEESPNVTGELLLLSSSSSSSLKYKQKVVQQEKWLDLFVPYAASRTSTASTVDCSSDEEENDEQYLNAIDPWAAAKRGDLKALQSLDSFDWTRQDDFQNTPLYYACHSGVAFGGLPLVRFLLDAWPDNEIPLDIMVRCKKNALNASVVRLLDTKKSGNCSFGSDYDTDDNALETIYSLSCDDSEDEPGLILLFSGDVDEF